MFILLLKIYIKYSFFFTLIRVAYLNTAHNLPNRGEPESNQYLQSMSLSSYRYSIPQKSRARNNK